LVLHWGIQKLVPLVKLVRTTVVRFGRRGNRGIVELTVPSQRVAPIVIVIIIIIICNN
uniref:Secreted protein n=1 Tax=Brugia pahangi TaxID=6280 RepID=A0A0N4T8V7_BRUPA